MQQYVYIYIVFPRTRTHHNPDQQMFDSALQQLSRLLRFALLRNRLRLRGTSLQAVELRELVLKVVGVIAGEIQLEKIFTVCAPGVRGE